jgi:hypothetical protein
MADIREIGVVRDIDGFSVSVCTEGGRIRLEVGSSVVVLDEAAAEEFARLFVAAAWEAGRHG